VGAALTDPTSALPHSAPQKAAGVSLPFCLTFLAAASILFSIAASQIAMALALVALLLSRERLRLPPLKAPFIAILVTTLLALLLSADPIHGLPQIRKLYVFTMPILIVNTFRNLRQMRALQMTWAALASVSALRGVVQYLARRHDAFLEHANDLEHAAYYDYFLDNRIHGLTSHWMTFGGMQMIVLILLASVILFATARADRIAAALCLPLIAVSLVLGLTRGVFLLGAPAGLFYLLWQGKRVAVLVLPAAAALIYLAAPFQVRDRVLSVIHPHGDFDSNARRVVTLRTGWQMIKAHPWFGLGPEQIGVQFERYVPTDVPRPLPKGWYGHLHNIYLQYAAERGIAGLVAVLWFVLKPPLDFFRTLRMRRAPPSAGFILHGAIAVTLAVLAEGLVEHNLGDSEVLTMWLASIGLGYAALNCVRESTPCA
jgi:putative inorganic carbon (hco3(-)) transporter